MKKMFYDVKYSITDNDYGSYVFEDYDGYEILTEDGIHQGVYQLLETQSTTMLVINI